MNSGQKLKCMIKSISGMPAYRVGISGAFVRLFGIVFLTFSYVACAQRKIIKQLKSDNQIELSLYFYPSTLRMVNLQKNEEFNRLIRDIKKMIFYKMNASYDQAAFYQPIIELKNEENLEEYIVVDGPGQKLYILGREDPAETVGLAFFQNERFIFDVTGSLSIREIPKLYEYLAAGDATFSNTFLDVFDVVNLQNRGSKREKREGY